MRLPLTLASLALALALAPSSSAQCGSLSPYDGGCPGAIGLTPKLGGTGCPSPGGSVSIFAKGGPSGAPAFLALGLGTGTLPLSAPCQANIAPYLGGLIAVTLDANGALDLPFTLPSGFPQVAVTMQLLVVEVQNPPDFLSLSNGLEMKVL